MHRHDGGPLHQRGQRDRDLPVEPAGPQRRVGTLRLSPSTVASYRKSIRLHVKPYIGDVPLAALTSARLTGLYRQL
jgi:hypothetical protein